MTTHDYRDQITAGLYRAAAVRFLHNYRSAFNRADPGGTDAVLIEPPAFEQLGNEYQRLVEEHVDDRIEKASHARAAMDLLALILTDQTLGEIVDEAGPVSIDKDRADALRLVASLSGWVNRIDIDEGITKEATDRVLARVGVAVGEGNRELRRRVAGIMAEFGGPLPEATDDGILEAERRLAGLRAAQRELHEAMPWDADTEQAIIAPTLMATVTKLADFIEDTPAQSLRAAAAKLRELLVTASAPEDAVLLQVLEVLERKTLA